MEKFDILDCSLRDGGYYTLWDFEKSFVSSYCELIANLPIKYIEVGYRSLPKKEYLGEYFYTPLKTLTKIRESINPNQKIAIMINAKDCESIKIEDLLSNCINIVSLVRIAVDPKKLNDTFELVKKLKSLNFEVAINLMYISKIDSNENIFEDLKKFEQYLDYLYLVDSYGTIYPNELEDIIKKFKVIGNFKLGFHGHNNLELAFINSLKAIELGVKIIDATVIGMGRGAGNLKLELILTYLKSKCQEEINLTSLSKLYELFIPLLKNHKWGTNLPYMISGAYSLPQKDVMEAIEINRYSISNIVSSIYNTKSKEYKKLPIKDEKNLSIVVIGGGPSIKKHFDGICDYLGKEKNITIIHSSSKYIDDFKHLKNIQYFCITGDESTKLSNIINNNFIDKYILEPSPRKIQPEFTNESFYELASIDFIDYHHDSPLCLSLQTAITLNASKIELIGFDGYQDLNTKKDFLLMKENQEIISTFSEKIMKLSSLTKTNYKDLINNSIYGKLN